MIKKTLILFTELKEVFDTLSDEQAGQLIKAIFEYEQTNILPDLQGLLKIVFIPIRQSIDRNRVKYDNVCERNKENIGKRWNKNNTKNTSGKIGINKNTKNTDKDKDKDSDKDSDSDNKNKKEKDITLQLVIDYFSSNGYSEDSAIKFYNYYDSSNWVDTNGKKVSSWKQKAIGVWFKPENIKKQDNKKVSYVSTEDNQW
jgi:hypothetical protein